VLRDVEPGAHTLCVRVFDAAGNQGQSAEVAFDGLPSAPAAPGAYARALRLLERFAFGPETDELGCVLTRGERAPDFAVLIYPAVDRSKPYRSQQLFANGFLLTAQDIAFFNDQYFGNDPVTQRDPKLSPLLREDLSGLCPSVVVTAGFDPLRDEGAAYAEALSQAGNQVTLRCEHGLTHGFINMTGPSPACAAALLRIAHDTRALARK